MKEQTSVPETLSGNNALKYISSGDFFVDQFGSVSKFFGQRLKGDIYKDMAEAWKKDPLTALTFTFYLRTITRVVHFSDGTKTSTVQKGQGLRHESIYRMLWLSENHPEVFMKNLQLFLTIGSWKDIFVMLSYDLIDNTWENRKLDWNWMMTVILAGLQNPNISNLIKKYLPQIRVSSKCNTPSAKADNIIAKRICFHLFGQKTSGNTYRDYRKFKTSGNAHEWQKLISKHLFDKINFDTIAGRALSQLVSSQFLKNNNLVDKYEAWLSSKPVVKFTGYPFELFKHLALKEYQKKTIETQFQMLLEQAKSKMDVTGYRPIAVLDVSSSMNSKVYIAGGKISPQSSLSVAAASALFFNEMYPESAFYDTFLYFSTQCKSMDVDKGSIYRKYISLINPSGWGGSTNLLSVFHYLADWRLSNPEVNEKLLPNMFVLFSDGEFNRVTSKEGHIVTNIQAGKQLLLDSGYSKEYVESFGVCFVDIPNTFYHRVPPPKFETFESTSNVFYFSGYDMSPLSFLFGIESFEKTSPKTAKELFEAAMNQEVFNRIEL